MLDDKWGLQSGEHPAKAGGRVASLRAQRAACGG